MEWTLQTVRPERGELNSHAWLAAQNRRRPFNARLFLWLIGAGLGLNLTAFAAVDASAAPANEVVYKNHRNSRIPTSAHVVRVLRGTAAYQVWSVHAEGQALGLTPLSQQAASIDPAFGKAIAGINGDFYQRRGAHAGDPRGLQVIHGELISGPTGTASFWIDASGQPHLTNTASLFTVTWPDGTTGRMGLNGSRRASSLELYTPSAGRSTGTSGGRELVLEPLPGSPWLPLRPGESYRARVREIRENGNTRLLPNTMVFSIGPAFLKNVPKLNAGAVVVISTETAPDLKGTKMAISGGPILVRDGKPLRVKPADSNSYKETSMTERHPRSAAGWNEQEFFLVQVDGRHRESAGMTLNELANFLVEIGCQHALNLDGGGSSTLWFNGKVQNRPCDGYERSIANSVVVIRSKPQDAGSR